MILCAVLKDMGIMIPQKLSMKWIIDRHAIASRDEKEMRENQQILS